MPASWIEEISWKQRRGVLTSRHSMDFVSNPRFTSSPGPGDRVAKSGRGQSLSMSLARL
jgi:hypothetical protein